MIRGNAAIFKCAIPAYISDFLHVDAWFQDDVPIHRDDKYGRKNCDTGSNDQSPTRFLEQSDIVHGQVESLSSLT